MFAPRYTIAAARNNAAAATARPKSQRHGHKDVSMKPAIFILALLTLIPTLSHGRNLPEDSLSLPVLIVGNTGYAATGFYLTTTTSCFLVTAKHVLYQEDGSTLRMDNITLLSYPVGMREYNQRIEFRVDLRLAASKKLIRASSSHDVALVWIAKSQKTAPGEVQIVWGSPLTVKTTTNTSAIVITGLERLKSYTKTVEGDDAYVFGYPSSIGLKQIPWIDYHLPLLRKGIIAGKNPSRRTIILDAPIYPGNSGGPVMEVEQIDALTTTYSVIGIVTDFVPFEEEWENKRFKYSNHTITNSG